MQVVGDELMTAVGARSRCAVEHRMRLEQQVKGVRQRVDVDRTLQVRGETHEVVRLGEHFLAERQLANDRRWKHGCLSSLDEIYDRSTSSISSLPESISSCASASRISSNNVRENPLASDCTVAASTRRLSYHQSRCSTPAVRYTRSSIAWPRPGIASRTGNRGVGVEPDRRVLGQRRQLRDRADVGEEDVRPDGQRQAAALSGRTGSAAARSRFRSAGRPSACRARRRAAAWRSSSVGAGERDGIDGGEPADGAAQVDVGLEHRATLAAEVDGDGPVTDRWPRSSGPARPAGSRRSAPAAVGGRRRSRVVSATVSDDALRARSAARRLRRSARLPPSASTPLPSPASSRGSPPPPDGWPMPRSAATTRATSVVTGCNAISSPASRCPNAVKMSVSRMSRDALSATIALHTDRQVARAARHPADIGRGQWARTDPVRGSALSVSTAPHRVPAACPVRRPRAASGWTSSVKSPGSTMCCSQVPARSTSRRRSASWWLRNGGQHRADVVDRYVGRSCRISGTRQLPTLAHAVFEEVRDVRRHRRMRDVTRRLPRQAAAGVAGGQRLGQRGTPSGSRRDPAG